MKTPLTVLVLFALVFAFGQVLPAQAAVITTPADLNPGDQFRVAFVSSSRRDALSTTITDHDQFISGLATTAGIDTYFGSAVTWQVLGSTTAISAISRVPLISPSIHLVDGIKVADDGADLWDGSIDVAILLTEFGVLQDFTVVHTGTLSNGAASPDAPLGGFAIQIMQVGLSSIVTTDSSWISVGPSGGDILRWLYGISSVLTVPMAVPEPASY